MLIPYEELPEAEKDYDRRAAQQTVKALVALGFRIVEPARTSAAPSSTRKPGETLS
jgi:hypothetical protein